MGNAWNFLDQKVPVPQDPGTYYKLKDITG